MKNPEKNPAKTQRYKGNYKRKVFAMIIFLVPIGLFSQDFGFGDSDFGFTDSSSSLSVDISGEAKVELTFFPGDFSSAGKRKNMQLPDMFSAKLNFLAGSSAAQAVINLDLIPVFDGSSPVEIDEAFARVFFGPLTVEGGIRKLTWGKADSFGPLDVVNPLDYSDITQLSDPQNIKIGRPMIHSSWSLGSFTKLEAVFVPWFQGHKFDTGGRWAPRQVNELFQFLPVLVAQIDGLVPGFSGLFPNVEGQIRDFVLDRYYLDYKPALRYAQGGARFTTSLGSQDLGFQYYFGRLQRPRIKTGINDFLLGLASTPIQLNLDTLIDIDYNYYHQIGVDYARVVAGFNLRAEAGANITKDLDGRDGAVENPFLVWSLGFDRDLLAGINLNLQGTGRLRLLQNRLDIDPLVDCEAGMDMSSTRITGILSRKFLRDELELKATFLWGIEDRDFLVMPALVFSRDSVRTELSAGLFGGEKKGELGQYRDNAFVRVILTYQF